MITLIIGGGGREHALALALDRDPLVKQIHAAPGNPGIGQVATLHDVDINHPHDVAVLAESIGADLVIVGPEAPLVAGVADAVRDAGIPCFGPSADAAVLEGSKAFAKQVMAAAEVPTALAHVCTSEREVAAALDGFGPPYVVKDDALASGKGVVVTSDRDAALAHARTCKRVVIEEYLDGPEVSLFAITDGESVLPLIPAQDFKRIFDNDKGANTGGMGAYTPLDWTPNELVNEVSLRVLLPTLQEMTERGVPFRGLLYAGLALTSRGLKVIEFNVRFGDPETQAILALLRSPLSGLLLGAAKGILADVGLPRWHQGSAITVVLASHGYPESPRLGDVITGVERAEQVPGVQVIHAGTAWNDAGELVTAGGRVLSVTARGDDLPQARARAYEAVQAISFDGMQYRTDIALAAQEGTISL